MRGACGWERRIRGPIGGLVLLGLMLSAGCGKKEVSYLGVPASAWRRLVTEDAAHLREAGLRGLARVAVQDARAAAQMARLLALEDPRLRGDAQAEDPVARAIADMGPAALPLLARATAEGTDLAQARAWKAIALMGEPALPLLEELLRGNDVPRRIEAAQFVRTLGPTAAPLVPALIADASYPNSKLAKLAILDLGGIGAAAPEALSFLIATLDHPEAWARQHAVQALAEAALAAPEARAALERAREDANPRIAGGAQDALTGLEELKNAPR